MSYQKPSSKTPSRPQRRQDTAASNLSSQLGTKPQRRQPKSEGRRTSSILLTVGGILLVIILVFAGIKLFSAQGQPSSGQSSQNTTGTSGNGNTCIQGQTCAQSGNAPIETQPDFVNVVKNQVAQGLHLTPDQLQTKLQTGQQITDLAQQQGLSLDQWHTLELNATKVGIQKLVSEGKLSQDAGNAQTQQWQTNLDNMDSGIQLMLGGCPPQPSGVTGCPPPGPGVIKKG